MTLSVRVYAQGAEAKVRHLRTQEGRQAYRRQDGVAVVPAVLLGP